VTAAVKEQAGAVWAGVTSRIDRRVRIIRRTTPGPVILRTVAAVAALVALLVALPPSAVRQPAALGLCVVLVAGIGFFPRTRWVTLVIALGILAWIYSTLVDSGQLSLWRLVTVTAGLYTAHTGAALASVLPHDAIVAPGVLARWGLRTGAVLGVSIAVSLSALVVAERITTVSTLVAPVLGVIAVAGVTVVMVWLWRRR
jgi:hypothetical protein